MIGSGHFQDYIGIGFSNRISVPPGNWVGIEC